MASRVQAKGPAASRTRELARAAYPKPPSRIRIGIHTFRIKPDASLYSRDQTWGECDHLNRLITYEPRQAPLELVDTILHEISHAIFSQRGFKSERSSVIASEERIVHNMTQGLLQVLYVNRRLRDWINEVLDECAS